ncbi:DivIVA domain-containing protein [Nocardiopsis sp. LOL_012]|uniref:DivIVA domain-containing protein n=1 Tax=Nocardiopsis sp. LOL_012 TaxID=3345409 RepID=UPI003A852EFE
MRLTPADIREKKFHTVRLRAGYSEKDVDDFLDLIESTLAALEGTGPRTEPLLSADDVREARFRTTRFSPGYDEEEVDDFLDTVAADLAGRGLGRAGAPSAPVPPLPQTQPPPHRGAPEEPERDARRLTPEDIREQRFATTRLTTGYHEQEVDDFLDRAEFTVDMLQQGRPERATLTAADVERIQFSTTRARPGYDPTQVDRFLDFLAQELRKYEGR